MKGVTPYQSEVLQHVADGAEKGMADPIDFDQLLERLSWKPTKQSAQFVVRALITKGLMQKADMRLRRGRKRVTFQLTKDGELVLDPRPAAVSGRKLPVPDAAPAADLDLFVPGLGEVVLPG